MQTIAALRKRGRLFDGDVRAAEEYRALYYGHRLSVDFVRVEREIRRLDTRAGFALEHAVIHDLPISDSGIHHLQDALGTIAETLGIKAAKAA